MNIEILVVEDHTVHRGKKAILHESDASRFVRIVNTSATTATVEHTDGQRQKTPWNRLSVEITENDK